MLSKKTAFTIAELLIVIGILGIIAEYTIPTLIKNVNERAWTTANSVFVLKLKEVANQMAINDELSGYNTNELFLDTFAKYMKIGQRCTSANLSNCFAPVFKSTDGEKIELSTLKTSADLTTFQNSNPLVGFSLVDGTGAILAYNPTCAANYDAKYNRSIDKTQCFSMIYDINGGRGPNIMSKDIFAMNASIFKCNGMKIDGLCVNTSDTPYPTIDTCTGSADVSYDATGNTNPYCAANAWAGAKKACGALGMRLPNNSELNKIIQAYKSNPSGGLNITGNSYWTSQIASGNWVFYANTSGSGSTDRKDNTYSARCVK